MVWLVQLKLNLTACDTIFRGNSTQRILSEHIFSSEAEAIQFYESQKDLIKFTGLTGQYVTFPREFESYEPSTHFCDECGRGFETAEPSDDNPNDESHLGFTDLPNGNFCSRQCFRSSFQSRHDLGDDPDYDDEY